MVQAARPPHPERPKTGSDPVRINDTGHDKAETSGMDMTGFRRGPVAALSALILATGAAAWAEAPTTHPQPRPILETAAVATPPAATTAQPAVATAAPPAATPASVQTTPRMGPVTGFPLPRYVSIKASEANARRGPSRSHRIDWVFQRRNMPVMIVAEHGHWRRVVDRDGAGGWIHYTLLSGVRTAIVEADRVTLFARPDRTAMVRAEAERGVIGELRECRVDWCEMEVGGYRGWVEARNLWGVDPGESFD
jgi:SH3-like domain-containing protein